MQMTDPHGPLPEPKSPVPEAPEPWLRVWLAPLAVTLLAVLVRVASLDHGAYVDELYHLLAARGWLAEGELRIAEGIYPRAAAYSVLTAWAFELFGESLLVARSLAVLFGSLLVLAVFVWTRRVAGGVAAWTAALLLCFSPDAIMVSRFARFYALHGFLFFLGAIGVYSLIERRPGLRSAALIGLGSAACFALAFHLQVTTAVGLLGILLWTGLVVVLPWFVATFRTRPGLGWTLLAGALLAGAGAAAVVLGSGLGEHLLAMLRATAPWAAELQDAFWYYHVSLGEQYGSLWPLTPLAALIGLATRPRPTVFCLLVFTPALIVHSFGGMKSMRYLYYVLPFLFVLWGIALEAVGRGLLGFVRRTGEEASDVFGLRRRRWLLGGALPAALVLFMVASNGAFVAGMGMMLGVERFMPVRDAPRWEAARAHLEPWLEEADVVVTGSELEALYYLDRYDVLVSRSRAAEISQHGDFDPDPRTGRPVITTSASLELLTDCYRTGLIVTPARLWRMEPHIDREVANWILEHTRPLGLPPDLRVMAFVWDRPVTAAGPECAPVDGLLAAR